MGVLRGSGGGAEGWGSRGQASELTDLGDYIKTTHLSIIRRREEATKRGHVLKENIFTGLRHVMNVLCMIILF